MLMQLLSLVAEGGVPWDTPAGMGEYPQATRLVDLDSPAVRETAARLVQGISARRDAIPASEVLRDGYGQCNTKSVLLVKEAKMIPQTMAAILLVIPLVVITIVSVPYWIKFKDSNKRGTAKQEILFSDSRPLRHLSCLPYKLSDS